tara:strand:+ start:282 stop:1082 length:801 start_codon:yes stop_codon:yes gene_type:complete
MKKLLLRVYKYFLAKKKYIYQKIRFRIIFDKNLRLPINSVINKKIDYKFYSKEILVRDILFRENKSNKLSFLDVGADHGDSPFFLNIYKNFILNKNYESDLETFKKKYDYYSADFLPIPEGKKSKNFILGDICSENYLKKNEQYINFFDVIYSNNVFEHLKKPWLACSNINKLLKVNGTCITIVPFSQRYHEDPVDCFRYTHQGIRYLFENEMELEIIASGYDIDGRRNDWNGTGLTNDYIPEDSFGSWRETWFTILIFKKIKSLN